jgi:hypothetical protein
VNDEGVRMWKKAVVVSFKVLPRNLAEGRRKATSDVSQNSQDVPAGIRTGFLSSTSQKRYRRASLLDLFKETVESYDAYACTVWLNAEFINSEAGGTYSYRGVL